MNTFDPFENERIRREWIAQEKSCRDDDDAHDSRTLKYRLISRMLRDPPLDPIPFKFAAQTAARAELAAELENDTLERWLERGLLGALAVVGCISLLYFGGNWLGGLDSLRSTGVQAFEPFRVWSIVAAGCVFFSKLVGNLFSGKGVSMRR